MAIQIPNPGTGNGASGDNEFVLWTKVKSNFEDQTNAASRLVGTAAGNVMQVGAFGFGGSNKDAPLNPLSNYTKEYLVKSRMIQFGDTPQVGYGAGLGWSSGSSHFSIVGHINEARLFATNVSSAALNSPPDSAERIAGIKYGEIPVIGFTATKDPNGFLKGASPIAEIYSDHMDLNHDAEQQGVVFEKLGAGDYLIKGSLGFAQDGWYIETPKDANGNVLVAVVYEQLANNDLSIKTYAKKFDDETGDIVANLTKPRDIPTGRFISLRLHELPKEPPMMPTATETQLEV